MKKRRLTTLLLAASLMLSGCGAQQESTRVSESISESEKQVSEETAVAVNTVDTSEWFSDRDFETDYEEKSSVRIELSGDTAACSSKNVQISGSTITVTAKGTYIISGTLNDGMIVVNAEKDDKIQLVLDGVSINSENSAPIYILQADKVFITLAAESSNVLSNGGSFTAIDENNIDSVIFSKDDLTLNGSGNLSIVSPAGHGIVSKDELTVTGGTYEIQSASHGMTGKDNVCIADGTFYITSGKDGIHAENTEDASLGYMYIAKGSFDISAEGDGMSASAELLILDGSFDIVGGGGSVNASQHSSGSWGGFMGGGRGQKGNVSTASSDDDSTSMKGIKSSLDMTINGGSFMIDAADDALHSNASVTINGGSFSIITGDDGIHADETLTVLAGAIEITESYEGLEGLHVIIEGGDITLTATDDGLNAAGGTDQSGYGGYRGNDRFGSSSSSGSIVISDGTLHVTASGDGIDANGYLEITGGMITVCGPNSGDTATLDYDISAAITGGTFIGTGASQMAQTFSSSEQGVIAISVGKQSAGSRITVADKAGKTLLDYEPELAYSVLIFTCPELVKGESYAVTVGSSSGDITAN